MVDDGEFTIDIFFLFGVHGKNICAFLRPGYCGRRVAMENGVGQKFIEQLFIGEAVHGCMKLQCQRRGGAGHRRELFPREHGRAETGRRFDEVAAQICVRAFPSIEQKRRDVRIFEEWFRDFSMEKRHRFHSKQERGNNERKGIGRMKSHLYI